MLYMYTILALLLASAFATPELTTDNFDASIAGKGAFIKFFAPWCGHCKKMKPVWDNLSDAFAGSETVIIADVDCTVEKTLCSRFGVRGYPTIKYFTGATSADGEKYEGGRDFATLKKFADESLGPSCSFDNIELCDEDQTAIINEAAALSSEARAAWIAEQDATIKAAEDHFTTSVDALQKQYQDLTTEKDATIAAASPKLSLYRTVKDTSAAHDEL